MTADKRIEVDLAQQQDYRFSLRFAGSAPPIVVDEPPPLGGGAGPSPVELLAAAVGSCLSDSLLFALRKFRQQPEPITTHVQADVGHNAEGRLRVQRIDVTLTLGVPAAQLEHLDRVLATFGAYCTVTQSVSQGIDVQLAVVDAEGLRLK